MFPLSKFRLAYNKILIKQLHSFAIPTIDLWYRLVIHYLVSAHLECSVAVIAVLYVISYNKKE